MSHTLDERIQKTKQRVAMLERQKKIELRKEREVKKRKDQRRNYIVGELVTKYFPELKKIEPGTKAENAINFEALESFLSILSSDEKLLNYLEERATTNISITAEKGPGSDCPQNV